MINYGILGGGAAGIFAAITLKRLCPGARVVVLEKTKQLLTKVKISGGGRCNVTHSCFEPKKLVENYPRGKKELIGPFSRFQPKDTIQWFQERNIALKTENDGRMFPSSNSSQTIIDCFLQEAKTLGVEILQEQPISSIKPENNLWMVNNIPFNALIMATGSAKEPLQWVEALGQPLIQQVPSLFSFNTPASPLIDLSGVSVEEAIVTLPEFSLTSRGPLLITHWGFSGPAILRLSAFAALKLFERNYKTNVEINWMPDVLDEAFTHKSTSSLVHNDPVHLPKSLWKRIASLAGINEQQRWAEVSKNKMEELKRLCRKFPCQIDGKTTYKQEFVTAGGVSLKGVNCSTMESKHLPNLYFAGEVLNIDGVTGGFNFQAAWTTAWIAAHAIATQHTH